MKVLLLDIDGVLNSLTFLKPFSSGPEEGRFLRKHHPERIIDPQAVERLNRVILATDAKCVLSSAWRVIHDTERVQRCLEHHGFVGQLIDRIPAPVGAYDGSPPETWGVRGHQIQEWLDAPYLDENRRMRKREISKFAIVDDSDDMAHLKSYLVRTTWEHGLQDEHVYNLIGRLL